MKDNFVKVLRMAGLGKLVMVCLVFVGASVFSTLSAQYVGKQQAISDWKRSAHQSARQLAIYLPSTGLPLWYSSRFLFTRRSMQKLVDSNTTVADAVESVFATMSGKTDRMSEYHATMVEYNKKYQVGNFDIYYAIKTHIKALLKG